MTYNYIGKDILGQLGGLTVSFLQRKKTDQSPNKQGIKSVFFQQGAILTELCLNFLPASSFLMVAGGANVMKNISWIGMGSFTNKILFSLSDKNVGELYTLLSICNTLSSSGGMLLGTGCISVFPNPIHRVILFSIFSGLQWVCFRQLMKLNK
jgi:Protein of unknown function, DUF647.